MQIHCFVALLIGARLQKPRTTTLDLDTAPGLLLDMFDVCTTVTDDLSAEVKAGDRLELDRNLLLGPFALEFCQLGRRGICGEVVSLLFPARRAQRHQAHVYGTDVHLPDWVVPVSLVPQSSRWLALGLSWRCS